MQSVQQSNIQRPLLPEEMLGPEGQESTRQEKDRGSRERNEIPSDICEQQQKNLWKKSFTGLVVVD